MPSTTTQTETGPGRAVPRMFSSAARITSNVRVQGGCHVLEMEPESAPTLPVPGQFVMLSHDDPGFPLLPRPFSLLGARETAEGPRLSFLIMPVGRATGSLCALTEGDVCQVVGPMGHGLEEGLPEGPLACVAGGYGIAPFLFAAERWQATDNPRLASLTVIFGARDAERLSVADRLEATGCTVDLCTEDGSRGTRGRVDTRLEAVLARGEFSSVLTCGPDGMMEAVGGVASRAGVPCRASLETVMGCGYAVCNGCAVGVGDPSDPEGYTYELACREGTLFDEARLQWNLF
ncbi:MAG: hypothetical protein P8N09_13380 [Planctomycetota bacterium]|nr:hypothetical protein [Planctomycetota bacterium]